MLNQQLWKFKERKMRVKFSLNKLIKRKEKKSQKILKDKINDKSNKVYKNLMQRKKNLIISKLITKTRRFKLIKKSKTKKIK